jgi:gluconolactonase
MPETERKLNPKTTALLLMELQNDVFHENGAFASSGAPAHAVRQNLVENVKRLAAAMRAAGAVLIHVHYVVEPGARGLKLNAPLFQAVADTNSLVRHTWGAAPLEGLEPQPGEFIVEKMRMNAFCGTRLETLLEGCGVQTVVLCGGWTNFSVEHTARHAADAGYEVIVASDGTATIDEEWQNAALNYALQNIAARLSCDEIIQALC